MHLLSKTASKAVVMIVLSFIVFTACGQQQKKGPSIPKGPVNFNIKGNNFTAEMFTCSCGNLWEEEVQGDSVYVTTKGYLSNHIISLYPGQVIKKVAYEDQPYTIKINFPKNADRAPIYESVLNTILEQATDYYIEEEDIENSYKLLGFDQEKQKQVYESIAANYNLDGIKSRSRGIVIDGQTYRMYYNRTLNDITRNFPLSIIAGDDIKTPIHALIPTPMSGDRDSTLVAALKASGINLSEKGSFRATTLKRLTPAKATAPATSNHDH